MLPFDTVAGQQPEWDHRLDLTPGLRVVQVFTATEDDLSRIEVFLVPDADGADTGLRFALWESGDPDAMSAEPLRASPPGQVVPIHGPGWFSYEHVGTLDNGVHVLVTWTSGGGSGVFGSALFVRPEQDAVLANGASRARSVLRVVGEQGLGDRSGAEASVHGNEVTIAATTPGATPLTLRPR